jgi:ABC-type transporter Mla subunit MlaD
MGRNDGLTKSAYADNLVQTAGQAIGGHQTRRQALEQKRQYLTSLLQDVDSAIAALDAHPELEDFIETMARANV